MTAFITTHFAVEVLCYSSPFLLVKDDASLGYASQAACALQRHSKICRVSHVVLKCSQYVCRLELTKKLQSLKNDTYLLIFHYKRLFIKYTGEYKKLKKFSYAHNFTLSLSYT